jgi:hypothetical protein
MEEREENGGRGRRREEEWEEGSFCNTLQVSP